MADNLDKYLLTPSPLTASKLTKEAMKCFTNVKTFSLPWTN